MIQWEARRLVNSINDSPILEAGARTWGTGIWDVVVRDWRTGDITIIDSPDDVVLSDEG